MGTKQTVNSNVYWDNRFVENWESYHGPTQSRFFAELTIKNLPSWLLEQLHRQPLTLCDWGCAQGDGTDVWASYINSNQITGIDFSSIAIDQAIQRYPAIRFLNEDWLTNKPAENSVFDVIFSSNTLEHFYNPYAVLRTLCKQATKALILALPYRELDRHHEHFYTFLPANIPSIIDGEFRLVWSRVVDCRQLVNTQWSGDQIILVYAKSDWVDSLALLLQDCGIEQSNSITTIANLNRTVTERDEQITNLSNVLIERDEQITNLSNVLIERDEQITNLSNVLIERDEQITNLNQALIERDEQITNLNQALIERDELLDASHFYKIDKEIYIAMLKYELEKINSRIDQRALKLIFRLGRLHNYAKRSVNIIKSNGFSGLKKAIAHKLQNRDPGNRNNYIQPQISVPIIPVDSDSNRYSKLSVQPLLGDALVIITGVPFDDVGGGQRAAQLARCALKTGRKVIFLYVYKKFDFERNQHIESEVIFSGLVHKFIGTTSPSEILNLVSPEATLLIELPHSEALPYLHLFGSRGMRTVFELIDDWESSLGGDWFDLKVYNRIVQEAQFVVGTAKVLVEKLQALGRNDARYLPNAANEYIFDKYKKYKRPLDLPSNSGRIALYFGSLYGDWFGWNYLKEAAKSNPDMVFVLIGDKPSVQSWDSLPSNVLFLGGKKIEELPAYLAYSNIGLLPFLPGKVSNAVSPIKIFEYLFSGIQVVATNLPEIVDYPGVLIANSESEFAALCKGVEFTNKSTVENDRFIFENSWFSRLENLTSMGKVSYFHGITSAVILIHNNKSIIARCLESLLLHCTPYLKEVIVVDNASIDGGADFVEKTFPLVKVIRNPVNGCASGRNLGVNFATGKFIAFFDSDQWFTSPSCFEEALNILSRDANVGAVGWAGGWFDAGRDDLGGMITDYCANRAMDEFAIRHGYRFDIGYLGTGGFFVPKSVFDSTEGFDTAYDPTCFEDTDMSFQIKKMGFDICYRDLTGIRHQPHQTTLASSGSDTYAKLFKRNAKYFRQKWASYPQFFTEYSN